MGDQYSEYDCDCGSCRTIVARLARLEQMVGSGDGVRLNHRQVELDGKPPADVDSLAYGDTTFDQRQALRDAHAPIARQGQLPAHVEFERARKRKKGRWNWVVRLANQLFFYRHDHQHTVWRCFEWRDARLAGLAQQAILSHARKIDSQALHGWRFETHVDKYGDLYVRKVRVNMQVAGDKCSSYVLPDTVDMSIEELGDYSRD